MTESPIDFLEMSAGSGPPVGWYRAKLLGLTKTSHPEYGDGCQFRFEVVAPPEHAGKIATRTGKTTPTATNVTGKFLAALLGRTLNVGEKVSLQSILGKTFLVQVEQSPRGQGTRVAAIAPDNAVAAPVAVPVAPVVAPVEPPVIPF